MELKNLLFEIKESVGLVTVNRPEKLNALNTETMQELHQLFTEIKNNDEVLVVIITGAGDKAFVAGADIKELHELDLLTGKEFSEKGQAVFNLIENLEKPVIAAVNGYALGGGCELSLACHIRIASDKAIFGQPEVNLAVIPGYGGTQRLTRLINTGRAFEYILTGDMIKAEEALRIGLVNKVFEEDLLLPEAFKMAGKIVSKGQLAISNSIKSIVSCNELSQEEGQKLEATLFGVCCGSDDFKEGTKAFLEKRKPEFKNGKL